MSKQAAAPTKSSEPVPQSAPVGPPDIPYFARKGGWNGLPGWEFGPRWSLHSGNSTAAYSYHVQLGVAKEIEDARYYCVSRAAAATPVHIREEFPKLAFLPDLELLKHIKDCPVRTSDEEIAQQIVEEWYEIEPKLQQWSPQASAVIPDVTTKAKATSYYPTSEWKRALWQALNALGINAGYQECAYWIAEHLPHADLPSYFGPRDDVGYAVRQKANVRAQFQRDLSKVRTATRKAMRKAMQS
jgi:hypothetical protein